MTALCSLEIAIVLVQGSFQIPSVYQKLTDDLKNSGYPTFHPSLPSCSNTTNADFPSKTLDDDTEAVRKVVERLVQDEGKKVLVVMHSYGGLVGSNAISKELSYLHREAAGEPGGVVHLFYLAAFVLAEGQSVMGAFGESPNNDVGVSAVCYRWSVSWRSKSPRRTGDYISRTGLRFSTTTFLSKKRPSGHLG
jgi:pimeloyl-ACP methyl ester carboxylesterase